MNSQFSVHDLVSTADASASPSAASVLVVHPDLEQLLGQVTALGAAGFRVTAAASFNKAKQLLGTHPPDVLVTAMRLGDYNGLHLVVRGKLAHPGLGAILTAPEGGTPPEAEALGAVLIAEPFEAADLVNAVRQTMTERRTRPSGATGEGFRDVGSAPLDDSAPLSDRVADRRPMTWILAGTPDPQP